uniref:Centromere protein W-like n=1 Tax=Sinocyclocheilus anshuiensis TaxID=1608454 RepID=A0A671QGR9_9TELE
MSKKAPRAALKLHMKKNTNIRIGKNADLMAQLNILVVLHRLAEESRVKAFEEKSATIKVHHVRAVAKLWRVTCKKDAIRLQKWHRYCLINSSP